MFSSSSADGLLDPMSVLARYTCTESAEMICPRMMELSLLLVVDGLPLTTQVLCNDVAVVDDDA